MYKSLFGKLLIFLGVFVLLQAVQFGMNSYGFMHVGEEGALINEVGKQRMRTLLLAHYARAALRQGTRESKYRLDKEVVIYEQSFNTIKAQFDQVREAKRLRPLVDEAWAGWQQHLKPLILKIDYQRPSEAINFIESYSLEAIGQVDRIDRIVQLLEGDTYKDKRTLALLTLMLLTVSLFLGLYVIFFTRSRLIKPLRAFESLVTSVAQGSYDRRVVFNSQDELAKLGHAFNQMAEAVAEKTSYLSTLNQLAVTISSSLSPQEVVEQVLQGGMKLIGAEAACITLYKQIDGQSSQVIAQGLSRDYIDKVEFRRGSIPDKVFSANEPVQLRDCAQHNQQLDELSRSEGIRCLVCFPLISRTGRLGLLYFYRFDRDQFADEEIGLLTTFSHLAASAIDNAQLYAETIDLAMKDPLTGLANRRAFMERLQLEAQRSQRYHTSFAIIMADLDHFKNINDMFGHPAGDAVLKSMADLIKRCAREVDLVARFGGEEFMILLPELGGKSASVAAERIRKMIAAAPFTLPNGEKISLTASFGAICYPRCADKLEVMLERADQALYVAKQEGRNRVRLYRDILKVGLEKDPHLVAKLLNEDLGNLRAVVTAVEVKAPFLRYHSRSVEKLATQLGEAMGLSAEDRKALYFAAMLHDVGMVVVPEAILKKRRVLTKAEKQQLEQHVLASVDILGKVPALARALPAIQCHHERFDGRGYPDGLQGEEIPLLARILAVADAFVAMTGEWPGRTPVNQTDALREIGRYSGIQFDPGVVEVLISIKQGNGGKRRVAGGDG